MQLFWGRYGFPVNQAFVSTRTAVIRGNNRRPLRYLMRGDVKAELIVSGQADTTKQEDIVRSALATPYQDLILKQDDGKPSGTRLLNQKSLSGVMVVDGPNFTEATRAEYVNTRTVEFTVEAEYVFAGAESAIISFEETISVRGNGGPRWIWRFPLNGDAVLQQVSRQSLITTVQRGSAVGHTKYPPAPPPFAGRPPGIFVNEAVSTDDTSPIPLGRGWVNFPRTWYYEYRSVTPLVGTPSLPPLA